MNNKIMKKLIAAGMISAAMFAQAASEVVGEMVGETYTYLVQQEDEPSSLDQSYGPYIPGEKVSVSIPELAGYAANGLPSGLRLNKKTGDISGIPKKPTAEDGVTVTFTKKGAETLTTKFIVGPIPTVSVTLEGDAEKCKVTGANKAYLVGKKVTLQAKGPKGTAFVGWFRDGEPWPSEEGYLSAKLSYVMTAESLELVARFEKEKMVIDASVLEGAAFTVGTAIAEGEVMVNVETQSGLKSLAASGLPIGLKLVKNKKTGVYSIVGTPKKAGEFTVTFKATAKSGAVASVIVALTVGEKSSSGGEVVPANELPYWAIGTFQGVITDYADENEYGVIKLLVDASGQLKATIYAGGKEYELAAVGFDSIDKNGNVFADMRSSAGDKCSLALWSGFFDITKRLDTRTDWWKGVPQTRMGSFKPSNGKVTYYINLWRNENGADGRLDRDTTGRAVRVMEAVKEVGEVALKEYNPFFGDAVLTIGKDGSVVVSGRLADGVILSESGFLSIDDNSYWVTVDLVHYDAASGNVYVLDFTWAPMFDGSNNVVAWDSGWTWKDIEVYPFK